MFVMPFVDAINGDLMVIRIEFDTDETAIRVERSDSGCARTDAIVEYEIVFVCVCANEVLEKGYGLLGWV